MTEEAREAFRRKPRGTPEEEFPRLIDSGLITLLDNGQVKGKASKLFGEDEEEAESPPSKEANKKELMARFSQGQADLN